MTEPTTPAGRELLDQLPPTWWPVADGTFLRLVLAIEEQARAECRDADHIGQITQLGEMVDAARAEVEQARAEGRREAVRHRLLMPPHPGDVYRQSALCSCGEWQWDGDSTPLDYRAVLYDHTQHRHDRSSDPEPARCSGNCDREWLVHDDPACPLYEGDPEPVPQEEPR